MTDFSDFRENTRINSIVVQHALRQLDEDILSVALVEMTEEDRQIIYRNMSKRAFEMLRTSVEEKEALGEGKFREASERAQARIYRMFENHRARQEEEDRQTPEELEAIVDGGETQIIDLLVQIRRFVGHRSILALEGVDLSKASPLLRKGLELYVEGYDAAMVQSVLEQMKESLVTRFTNRQNLIIEGVGALMASTPAHEMREKLEAFRLGDP